MAFGTVVGAPTWQKPVHDPSRPTAAALAPSASATAVALADPPADDLVAPVPTGGGDEAADETEDDPEEHAEDEAEPEAEDEPVDDDSSKSSENNPKK